MKRYEVASLDYFTNNLLVACTNRKVLEALIVRVQKEMPRVKYREADSTLSGKRFWIGLYDIPAGTLSASCAPWPLTSARRDGSHSRLAAASTTSVVPSRRRHERAPVPAQDVRR